MIISIFAYLFCALILFITQAHRLCPIRISTKKELGASVFFSIIIFGIFYGIRYNTGTDNLTYIKIYENICEKGYSSRDNLEIGFSVIQNIFAFFNCHFSFFIGFWGALQMTLLLYATRKWKIIWPFLVTFIVLGPFFLEMSNIMRQTTAFCIFIIMVQFAVKKELIKYIIGVFICCIIHKSGILTLPLYFILRYPIIPKKRVFAIFFFIICTVIGNSPSWINQLQYLGIVLNFLNYDHYANSLNEIITTTKWSIAWGPARILSWTMILLTIWYYYSLSNKYNINTNIKCYFFLFYYGECLYNLLINTDQIFLRPIVYLNDFYVIMVPIIMYYLYKEQCLNKSKIPLKFIFYYITALFYSIYMSIHGYLTEGNFSPESYHFFFLE